MTTPWKTSMKDTYGIMPPCLGCPDRALACHDSCERFKEWKAAVDAIKEKRRKAKHEEDLLHPGIKRSKGKWERKK